MAKKFHIGSHVIGDSNPTYIIAEMSANHLKDLHRAHAIVDAAARAGADAIKLQTYTADTITIDCDNEYFQITQGTIWDGTTLHKLYEEAYTPWEWQPELKEHAESLGMDCFSSPFDPSAIDFLESIDVPAYKIASFEITDIPLIRQAARTGKPIILATGVAHIADIDLAVKACREEGNFNIAVLKCTSAYPCPYEAVNLKTMSNIAETFGVISGLSDHTMGHDIAVAAVALGANIVEKHLTLSRADGGPDGAFSMEPEEFRAMVDGIRNVEKALGHVTYNLTEGQLRERQHCRSLFVVKDMDVGDVFSAVNVRSIRPGFGINPACIDKVLGKRAKCPIVAGTPLNYDLLE